VMEVKKGAVTAIIYVQIAGDTMIECSITVAAAEGLGLYEGKNVSLFVDPTDVIIGCD
jgi:molybdopterin-binding protein